MRTILSCLAVVLFTALAPNATMASHQSHLSNAACAYRDAVVHFGHEVNADHRLSFYERRLAAQLVDTAERLYRSASHTHLRHHLPALWQHANALHRQIESVLFAHPGCPIEVALRPCWKQVICAHSDLSQQLILIGCHGHSHHNTMHWQHHHLGYTNVPNPIGMISPSQPKASLESYRYRNAEIPSYRYGR